MRKSKVLSLITAATLVVPQIGLVSATTLPKADGAHEAALVIINVAGTADTITVANTTYAITLYSAATNGSIVGTIAKGATAITGSKLSDTADSKVYAVFKSATTSASDPVEVSYSAAPQTAKIDIADVAVKNNFGSADTVTVKNVVATDTVALTVYKAGTSTKTTTKSIVATGKTTADFKIPQLGTVAGTVYATLTQKGKTESDVLVIPFKDEAVLGVAGTTTKEDGGSLDYTVATTTYYGIPDVITVTDKDSKLKVGDQIKIYTYATADLAKTAIAADKTKKDLLGSGTVKVTSKTDSTLAPVTISVKDLQTVKDITVSGSVYKFYVTVTRKTYAESERVAYDFDPDPVTKTNAIKHIVINNAQALNKTTNKDTVKDAIFVYGLQAKDKVSVYSGDTFIANAKNAKKDDSLIATGTVAAGQSQVLITIPAETLKTTGGSIWITSTRPGESESTRVEITYDPEQ